MTARAPRGAPRHLAAAALLACLPALALAAPDAPDTTVPGVDPWLGPWAGTVRATHASVTAGPTVEIDCSALDDCRGKLRDLFRRVMAEDERAARQRPATSPDGDAARIGRRAVISMIAWLDVGFEGIEFGFVLDAASGGGYRMSMTGVPEYQSILADSLVDDFIVVDAGTIETTFTFDDATTTLTLTMNDTGSRATLTGGISAPLLGAPGRIDFAGVLSRRAIERGDMLAEVRHRYKARKRAVRTELGARRASKSARN